ncbi:glycosyltransferase [Tumebacillus permanentifrigoris]|uniref:Glycosyl transferase family 1 n=1 Tax=Tumebacillus permanentifrigoris TaxID=378543 RepID=A0A316DTM2_9BACL|nr:glycosyltransferase [Tumebacillus permanentifrigoris]PWK11231.1 glycosyl transferase family 1 [Tumebacillus permanentifrigoris]
MRSASEVVRIGYVDGQSRRRYERVFHDWAQSLGKQVVLVKIPPFAFMKLFGGSIQHWVECLPESLPFLSEGVERLARQYGLDAWYVNLPMIAPYLLMARNYGKLDLGFLLIAHSVGSEAWLRKWVSVAPWLTVRDVLLTGSRSVQEALLQISPQFAVAVEAPPCITVREAEVAGSDSGVQLLAVGVDEGKNIEALLDCFAGVRQQVPDAHLTLLGEFAVRMLASASVLSTTRGGGVVGMPSWAESWARTIASSFSKDIMSATMAQKLDALEAQEVERVGLHVMQMVEERGLQGAVTFRVSATEEERDRQFRGSDLLVDLSTDPGETLGFHLLQAKACGLPVVCTGWNGFGELIEDDGDGVLIDVEWSGATPQVDLNGAVQTLVRLLEDPNLRTRMAARALERAHQYDNAHVMPAVTLEVQEAQGREVSWERWTEWAHLSQIEADQEPSGALNPVEHSLFSRSDMEERCSVANAVHQLAFTPLRQLGPIYHLASLESLGWLDETPTSVLTGGTQVPLSDWYPRVRSIIGHYAGKVETDVQR